MSYQIIGERIKELRLENKLSQIVTDRRIYYCHVQAF